MRSTASGLLAVVFLALTIPLHAGSAMAKLNSIVDGNTLVVTLRGAETKVRMHGLAVPPADETRPMLLLINKESVSFLKKYLSDGWVYLEFPEGGPKADSDGYVPAFVYRGSDATFLNEKLIAEGLALVNKKEPNSFTENWRKIQEGAKESERGIWGSFQPGDGEKIASGRYKTTYVGKGTHGTGGTSYVTYWIFFFY